jgi:hypothetical protein
MAINGAIPMTHDDVFPHGCFLIGEVEAVRDFDRSTKDTTVQSVDKETGVPVWRVDVIDLDPKAREKTVRVKLVAPVQPVPPAAMAGTPLRPVVLEGLTLRPWVNTDRCKPKAGKPHQCGSQIAWSLWATGLAAPPSRSAGKAEG